MFTGKLEINSSRSQLTNNTNAYELIINAIGKNDCSALEMAKNFINSQPATDAHNIYLGLMQLGLKLSNLDFISGLRDWYDLEANFPTANSHSAQPNTNTEPDVDYYAPSNFISGTIDLSANFDRVNILDVLKPDFGHMTEIEKQFLKNISPFVGKVLSYNNPIGTCFLINKNHVMLPVHCAKNLVGGEVIQFLSPSLDNYLIYNVESIIENSTNTDMATVKLNSEITLDFDSLTFGSTVLPNEKLFLLHYPEDGLQVSRNVCQLQTWENYSLITSHDTAPGSSGGVYFNQLGEIVGIHIGAEPNKAMFGRQKYSYLLTDLRCNIAPETELYSFLVPEGRKSRPELMLRLKKIVDGNITVPPGIATLSSQDIKTIKAWCKQTTYHNTVIKHMQLHCQEGDNDPIKQVVLWLTKRIYKATQEPIFLGHADKYGIVFSNWGVGYAVECDHLLPKFVLTSYLNGTGGTNNPTVRSYNVRGLPAIAIEYRKHRNLKTTNNDTTFSSKLARLCDQHKIPHALKKVLKDYKNNGLLTKAYKAGLLKLFNTKGDYYDGMVEKDIEESKMSATEAKACRDVMKECIKMINDIN